MTTARSIHVGLNSVDPAGYRGWAGRLRACEHDARAMQALCTAEGLTPGLLLTAAATRAAVLAEFDRAARELRSGDLLVVTYSGHGASFAEITGDEEDDRDEAWCLFDGVLLDDRLGELLAGFASGVEILVVSDSCYAGTMLRSALTVANAPPEVSASVLLLAACGEAQRTYARADRGLFTDALLAAWGCGRFRGSHHDFLDAIRATWPHAQLAHLGSAAPAFAARRPFTILP